MWYYIRRAIAELMGKQLGTPTRKSVPNWRAFAVMGAGLLFIIVFGATVWSLLPYGGGTSLACAFRIPEKGSPEPATAGDAIQFDVCVTLEKAVTPSARTLGLSNRPSMPRNRGMLFDFEAPGEYCMWMKDMNFSIDMMWLNEAKEILSIREDVSPDTYPKAFCGPDTGRYVVEVNAGIVQAGDLRVGQRLQL